MPRNSRAVAIGYPHHITQRGNNREPVFFDDHDRRTYLGLLKHYAQEYQTHIQAYCLMPNHIHLLVVPQTTDALALCIGRTNLVYTRHVNRKYYRSGRVWQNRFYSCIVDSDAHLWSVARYIENNPVKAALVATAVEYHWSSARCHLEGKPDAFLSGSRWLKSEEREDYRLFVTENEGRVADMINQATRSGRPFCRAETMISLEKLLGRVFP